MNSRIIPAFALFLAIALFFVYVNPMWTGQIAEKEASIAASKMALEAAEQYKKDQEKRAAEKAAIPAKDLSALATFLPDSVDNVGLVLDLDALAARSGISIINADVSPDAQRSAEGFNNPVGATDLTLSAIGTFSALQNFLIGVEKSARLLDVHDLSITGSDTGVYNYKMIIRLYWLR